MHRNLYYTSVEIIKVHVMLFDRINLNFAYTSGKSLIERNIIYIIYLNNKQKFMAV